MSTAVLDYESDLDQRTEERCRAQRFVTVQTLDMPEQYTFEALTEEISDSGGALIAHIALPVGTHLKISSGENFNAMAEVVDLRWSDWDRCGMVRIGLYLLEKNGEWPI